MQDIYVKLANIKRALEKKLAHPFLDKYLSSPNIDEDKLLLFYAIFDEIDFSEELKEKYIITAMLVQIALDTHDKVTTQNNISSTEFIQRQLTALAGDYFSGLYYSLLSEVEDIEMVRTLAFAIKEINEHKLRLYHEQNLELQSVIDNLIVVETALFQQVAKQINRNSIRLFITSFLTYKRLSDEKIRDKKFFHHYQHNDESLFCINDLTKTCNTYFQESISHLEISFFKTPAIKMMLNKRLKSIRFHETLHDKKTVEEGL